MVPIKREDVELTHERFRRIFNDPMRTDNKAGISEFYLPGFLYADFNRAGKLGVWNLLKNLEIIRRQEFKMKDNPPANDTGVNNRPIPVLSSQRLDVFPELYKNAALVRPMRLILRPGHAGTSSTSIFIEAYDAVTGVLYARNQRQLVSIDPVSRKTVISDSVYAKLKARVDPSAKPVIVPDWKPPPDAMTYSLKVLHTDADHLYHTNQATYLRFCVNAATNACNDGKLKNFSGDFLRYDVSSVLIRYLGESFPGDDIEVTLWEDQDDLDSLYFHISRSNKRIATAKLTYFKSATSKL